MTDSDIKMKKNYGPWIILFLTIIGAGVVGGMCIHQDMTEKEEISMYQKMDLFIRIDDIAHQEINETGDENPFTTQELKDRFYTIDNEFHSTKDIKKRHITIKKMINLLEEVEENRPTVTGEEDSDIERDNEMRKLLELFNKI